VEQRQTWTWGIMKGSPIPSFQERTLFPQGRYIILLFKEKGGEIILAEQYR
jgi:hypothetical protein